MRPCEVPGQAGSIENLVFFFEKASGERVGAETCWDCITDASHISVVQELKAVSVLAPLDSVDMASWLKHLCTTVLRGSKDSEGTQPKDWINGLTKKR